MKSSTFSFIDQDGVTIFCYKWELDRGSPRGIIQFAHGMTLYGGPFESSAEYLTQAGYVVYADDHRGHGRSAKNPQSFGLLGPNGWQGVLNGIKKLTEIAKKDYPGLPIFLFGHSWGSFLYQNYIQRWGNSVNGVILEGSNGYIHPLIMMGLRMKLNHQIKKFGKSAKGDFAYSQTFGIYNAAFAPNKTDFDWFSRDKAYCASIRKDPLMGWIPPNEFYSELVSILRQTWNPRNEQKIPKNLPILTITGSEDMVSEGGKFVHKLIQRYKKWGITDITEKVYPNARHCLQNEINKDEIFRDVISWLDAHVVK